MNTFRYWGGTVLFCGLLVGMGVRCGSDVEPTAFEDAKRARDTGDWLTAVELLEGFTKEFDNDQRADEAFFMLAEGYEKMQQWERAIFTYTAVTVEHAGSPYAARARERLAVIRGLGEELRGLGDFHGAATVFKALINAYPTDPHQNRWQVSLGFCSELAGEWQDAIDAYRGFLVRNPGGQRSDDVRTTLAWLEPFSLMMMEDFRGAADYPAAIAALKAFRKNHADHPRAPDALFWIAYAFEYNLDAPDMATAIKTYTEFRTEYPDHPYAAQALYQTGHCYQNDLDKPQPEKAITVFDEVVRTYPGTEWAERSLFAKADICERQLKRYRDAIDAYTEVLKPEYRDESRFQKFQYAHVRIGCIYKDHLNDFATARTVFKTIMERDPDGWYSSRVYWQLRLMDMAEEGRI